MDDDNEILEILAQAKAIAQRFYRITGKPLGITGEVAEYEAARLLGVKLAVARQAGYDATELKGDVQRTLHIKGRCLPCGSTRGQRVGSIRPEMPWDAVLLVLLDAQFNTTEIWEAERGAIVDALASPGSRARNERGALQVSKFIAIGRKRWPPTSARS